MADVRTNIRITADDAAARRLGQSLNKVFDKKNARELTSTVVGMQKSLATTTSTVVKLTNELLKVKQGTAAYKALSDELKNATTQAGLLQRALSQVEQVTARQEREASRQRREQRYSFVAGLGQGLGVSQYLPTGPGMMPRMAGAMVGGAVRRGVGSAAAPFLTPGMGGISRALSGIPIIGGALGGAVETAAGAYQQAVAYDRARWQNLAYGGAIQGRRWVEDRQVDREAKAGALAKAAGKSGRLAGVSPAMFASMQKAAASPYIFEPEPIDMLAATGGRGQAALRKAQKAGVAAAAGVGDRSTTMAEAYGSAKAPKGAKKGHWEKFTEWGPDTDFGVKFGMGPMQMQEAYGSFMGARGGVWDRESKGMFQEALAAQTRYGISAETSGQFARGAMPGGGFAKGGQGLAEVLATATEQGLSGSQVTEYLQTLVQLAQDQERNGVKIDTFNFTRGAALLGSAGVGLEGLQAQRVAGGLNQRAMQVGQQGVTNPADVMMMRAAGWDPSQGVEAYFATKNRLAEQGMSPEDMNRLIGMAAGGVQGVAGGGAETEKGLLAQFWKQGLGVSIGPSQAGEMLRYHRETGGNIPAEVLESWKRGETPGAREKLISEGVTAAGRAGTVKGAAGLEAMQVGVGQQAAAVVQGAERNQLALAMSVMSNFGGGLQQLNKLVLASIGAFDQFVKAISAGQKLGGALDWLNTVMTASGQ